MSILKDKTLLACVGLIILILVILFAGHLLWLEARLHRVIAVSVLLGVACIIFLITRLKEARRAGTIEKSLRDQSEEQARNVRPESRARIESLQEEFQLAVEALKKSKLGRGRGGRSALYALPWYMIVGPPGIGKTTMLDNSGLEFPYGRKVEGAGLGTRNCNWFFSTSAIFLDTAGRYMTEDENKEEWFSFLDILRKHRRRLPINGVIVSIGVADPENKNNQYTLMDSTTAELQENAHKIRNKLDELIAKLGVQFPVYLLFTKSDLVKGFKEFFQDMNRQEREQVLGSTFLLREVEKISDSSLFLQEFDLLCDSLSQRMLEEFDNTASGTRRRRNFVFPSRLRDLREKLSVFADVLFQKNPYQEAPIFRGFYFTSGTQEGRAIDSFLQSLTTKLNLPPITNDEKIPGEKKSYFIKDVISKVVLEDRDLGRPTSALRRTQQLVRLGTIAATVLAGLLFAGSASRSYFHSQDEIDRTRISVKALNMTDYNDDFSEYLFAIDRLRNEMDVLSKDPDEIRWNLSRREELVSLTRALHMEKFKPLVKRYFFDELRRRMVESASTTHPNKARKYNYLRSFLLMTDRIDRLAELDSRNALIASINGFFDETIYAGMRPNLVEELRPLSDRNVYFFVRNLSANHKYRFPSDENLVARIRATIKDKTPTNSIYESLKNSMNMFEPVRLDKVIGIAGHELLVADHEVPGAFTLTGWQYFNEQLSGDMSEIENDWVLGESNQSDDQSRLDQAVLGGELRRLYFAEYAKAWWQFLDGIRYRPFHDIFDAAAKLKALGHSQSSPILLLLQKVALETMEAPQQNEEEQNELNLNKLNVGNRRLNKVQDGIARFGGRLGIPGQSDASEKDSSVLAREFEKIHDLVGAGADGKQASVLGQMIEKFNEISSVIEVIEENPGIESLNFVRGESGRQLASNARNLEDILDNFDGRIKMTLKPLFLSPIERCRDLITAEAKRYIGQLWRDEVYDEFAARIKPFYPLNKTGIDVPDYDFASFFRPETGTFWVFYEKELRPFDKRGSRLRLSDSMFATVKNVRKLSDILFRGGAMEVKFSLEPRQPFVSKGSNPQQVCLSIDGASECYSMGYAQRQVYTWPGQDGTPGVVLSFVSRSGSVNVYRSSGVWSLFRFIESLQVIRRSAVEFELRKLHRDPNHQLTIRYKLFARTSENPFENVRDFFEVELPVNLF